MIRQGLIRSSRTASRLHKRKCSLTNPSPCCHPSVASLRTRWLHLHPLPMPAVAHYDDLYDDSYETSSKHDTSSSSTLEITMSSSSNDTPRFLGSNYRISGGGGGNTTGGGSKHRCPKCGAFVTFQENTTNRIQNCFYCAACSGWFLIQPESGDEHSKHLLTKMGQMKEEGAGVKRGLETQFVMQDVSEYLLSFD